MQTIHKIHAPAYWCKQYICDMKIALILLFSLGCLTTGRAQQPWNLKTVVDYAMQNNITVKLSDIQAKNADLTYRQSRLAQYPNANFSGNTSVNSGNNQDPTTFTRVTQTYLSAGFQLQTSADIFNFYSKRNTIAANEWELLAARANVDKLRYDIALNAANAYLQILLSLEQQKITGLQIAQTIAQLTNTRKLVAAGALPEINATQLDAQLAQDSVNYITAKGSVTQNILNLKSFMSIDAGAAFEVETPEVKNIPVEPIADMQPEVVYAVALANQPLQLFNDYKIKAAEKSTAAAKGAMYPSFSIFGALSSNYLAFERRPIFNQIAGGLSPTPLIVNVNGTAFSVQQPTFTQGTLAGYRKSDPFTNQLNNNFRQSVGLSMNVPIFNGGSLKTNYKRSRLNEESLQIQKQQDNLKLKQDIYVAYNAALIALEKLNASRKSITANELTYSFAQKRFDIGVLGTFDLITTQNNLLRSRLEYALNEYDYVFKMKVLEYYRGQGLKF